MTSYVTRDDCSNRQRRHGEYRGGKEHDEGEWLLMSTKGNVSYECQREDGRNRKHRCNREAEGEVAKAGWSAQLRHGPNRQRIIDLVWPGP